MFRLFAIAFAIITFVAPAGADDIFLQCAGYSRVPGIPPVDSDIEFSIRVSLEKNQIEHDDQIYRIYESGETELSAFTKFKTRDGKFINLIQLTLDRVSGKFLTIWQNSAQKPGAKYVYVFKHDEDQTELAESVLQYVHAKCATRKRIF